jgi:hypothetical protein
LHHPEARRDDVEPRGIGAYYDRATLAAGTPQEDGGRAERGDREWTWAEAREDVVCVEAHEEGLVEDHGPEGELGEVCGAASPREVSELSRPWWDLSGPRLRAGAAPGHVELSSHARRGGPWPADLPRELRAIVDDYATAAVVAQELALVTVLPTSMGRRAGLVELATPRLAPQPLFAVTRSRLEDDSRPEVVAALALELSRAAAPKAR